jgi:hypothetical protein
MQKSTTYADEVTQSGINLLLTFTNIGKNVLPDATQALLDMSTAMGQDVKQTAIQLGKALNDPILGATALRRVGVQLNEQQQEQIKTLVGQNKMYEAQKIILDELAVEFGGSASAAANTFNGRLQQVKNTFGDFQELIGEALATKIKPLIEGFYDWMESMGGPEGMMRKLNDEVLPKIREQLPIIIGIIIGGLVPAFYAWATSVWAVMGPLIPFLVVGAAIGVIVQKLVEHFGGWEEVMNRINPVLELLGKIFNEMIRPHLESIWKQLTEQLLPALQELWAVLEPLLVPLLKVLAVVFGVTLLGAIGVFIVGIKLVIEILTNLINTVKWVVEQIVKFFTWLFDVLVGNSIIPDMINAIVDWFKKLPDMITDGLRGLKDAIVKPFSEAFDKVKDMTGSVVEKLKGLNPFHRESPSLVDNVIKGVKVIKDQFDSLGNINLPSANLAFAGEGTTNNQTTQNININIDRVNDMQDVQAIGRELGFRASLVAQ